VAQAGSLRGAEAGALHGVPGADAGVVGLDDHDVSAYFPSASSIASRFPALVAISDTLIADASFTSKVS
jgi:hypothetical protein